MLRSACAYARQIIIALLLLIVATVSVSSLARHSHGADRPNVLIAISDDVSYPHASAYGSPLVDTPVFDQVAKRGVLFNNAFCCAPGCSPSRAALLTGRHIWMIEEAGTHASYFQAKYQTFPERLAEAGYFVGSTGKAWAPGNFQKNGRTVNPAGRRYSGKAGKKKSYAAGFEAFFEARPKDKPFCFWFGSSDAHRSYKKGSGLAKGKKLEQATPPKFLPDRPEIRSDLLDYAFEVERFDDDCGEILNLLKETGELDNTIVIVTSDNGMPFPRAKANCYEYGIHMPLAIQWPKKAPGSRVWDDLISFVDITATIYEATGVSPPKEFPVAGKSFLTQLQSDQQGIADPTRTAIYSGRERHSSSRYHSLSYPQRAIRTSQHLLIRNFKPHRWPAGTPRKLTKPQFDENQKLVGGELGPMHGGYHDIDACPSLTYLIQHAGTDDEIARFLALSVDRRPEYELFDIQADPACLNNLASNASHLALKQKLSKQLEDELRRTGDARVVGNGDIWESYPRVSSLRWFAEPDWLLNKTDEAPDQPWLEKRRPKAR